MPTKLAPKSEALPKWSHDKVVALHARYIEEDLSLRELGDEIGLTYERVRQLFEDESLPPKKVKRQTVRRYSKKFSADQDVERIQTLYRKHGTIEAVHEETGHPVEHISQIVANMPLREVYRRRGETPSYKHSYVVECLQEAAKELGEPLGRLRYREEAAKRGWPTDLTVIRAFKTWKKACDAAGVKCNPAEGPRKGAYTAQDCITAMRICAAEVERIPSYEMYSEWASERQQPSGSTVRVKVGPWRKALKRAFG